tara:strand:+ start:2415 stop:2918 length:504 start_codon:yes stop_codon:yes gene_type:complete
MAKAIKKGRPKQRRQYRFFKNQGDYGLWMENLNYKKAGEEDLWEDANFNPTSDEPRGGKPLPSGEEWGCLPDAAKFCREYHKADCIEDVVERFWWCSWSQLRSFRGKINKYITDPDRGFKPLKSLRSDKHLFGATGGAADRAIKSLIKDGVLVYVSREARNKRNHPK